MIFAMLSQQFRRAVRQQKFGSYLELRRASMLAERHLLRDVFASTKMQAISYETHLGTKAQLFVYRANQPHMLELVAAMDENYMKALALVDEISKEAEKLKKEFQATFEKDADER